MSETTLTMQEQPPFVAAEGAEADTRVVPGTFEGMPPTAQTFFAVVEANGNLARGFQTLASAKLGPGMYEVLFAHDLTNSAFVATLGLHTFGGGSQPGEIAVVGRAGANNGVFVQTFNPAGTPADRGFHIAVHS